MRRAPRKRRAVARSLTRSHSFLRQKIQRLNALNTQMMQTEDKQISLMPPKAEAGCQQGAWADNPPKRNRIRPDLLRPVPRAQFDRTVLQQDQAM
jgi:hypothetical protein